MLKQILKSGFRQIWRKPLLPVLNMLGLAGGIAVTLLILLYSYTELNYDSWVTNQDRLYRVEVNFVSNGGFMSVTPTPVKPTFDAELSEVESVVRVRDERWPVKQGAFVNYETIHAADDGFLDMFPLSFVNGSAESAFPNLNSIVISETMARKYFGDSEAVGQQFTLDGDREYIVTAVFEDLPAYTDFEFQLVVPFQENMVGSPDSWNSVSLQTFVRLKEGANMADVLEKLAIFVDQNRPFNDDSVTDMRDLYRMFLQPFSDLHLGSRGRTSSTSIGNYATIYGFLAIAALILVISTFNYVSLAMARAVEREREFCMRKVSGASHGQIVNQVMVESIIQTSLAALLGLLIAEDTLPYFSNILGAEYVLFDILNATGMLIFVTATLALGVLAGMYPAIITSRFRPVKFLSGGRSSRGGINKLRAILVFVQFSVSIALLIGAVTISRQMIHINKLDVGYNADGMLVIQGINREETRAQSDSLKNLVSKIPGVISVTRSAVTPHMDSYSYEGFFSNHVGREDDVGLRLVSADYDFMSTYQATLAAGRFLEERFASDKTDIRAIEENSTENRVHNVVINRRAVTRLGFKNPEQAIGQPVFMMLDAEAYVTVTVVGVLEDMMFTSARNDAGAKIYYHSPNDFEAMSVRVEASQQQQVARILQETWTEMFPDTPYWQDYIVDRIESLYRAENQQLSLFMLFSGLTVLLSLVGLIGLVLNSVGHRVKEISIRRVLGASVGDNVKLFTWQYAKPVLIANIPAWAAAYYFLNEWLEKYPRRVELSPEYYIMGGGVILAITVSLVVVLVIRAASTSPALALKHE